MNVLSPLREQFHDNRFLQSQIQLSEESSLLGQGTYSLILYYGVNGEDNHESISPHSEEPRNELIINVQDLFDALLYSGAQIEFFNPFQHHNNDHVRP